MHDQILRVVRDDGVAFTLGAVAPTQPSIPGHEGRFIVNYIYMDESLKSVVHDEDGDEQTTESPAMCHVAMMLTQHIQLVQSQQDVPPEACAAVLDFPLSRVAECMRVVKVDELAAMIEELIREQSGDEIVEPLNDNQAQADAVGQAKQALPA